MTSRSLPAVSVPWLLVHGTADEIVPLRDSLEARAAAGGRPALVELPGVNHVFEGVSGEVARTVAQWLVAQGFGTRRAG